MPINLDEYKRVPQPIEVAIPSTTAIESSILATIAGLEELKTKVNANDVVRTTKQNAMVTAVQTAINDLYSKLDAIGNMSASDLENLQTTIKTANDIVSNGVNGLVKAIDGILKELNKSKQIEFVDSVVVDTVDGFRSIDLPITPGEVFIPVVNYWNKPHNASEVMIISVNEEVGTSTLDLQFIDSAHFVSSKVPFDCSSTPIEVSIAVIKGRVNLLSFEIEKPTETTEDKIINKDTVTVGG